MGISLFSGGCLGSVLRGDAVKVSRLSVVFDLVRNVTHSLLYQSQCQL